MTTGGVLWRLDPPDPYKGGLKTDKHKEGEATAFVDIPAN